MQGGSVNPRRPGFTIIEVIVVAIILVILAAAIAPRLMAMGGREVRAAALAAGDLVSVAARRDALTSQRVALEFNADDESLELMTMQAPVDDSGTTAPAEWQQDKLMQPVRLGDTSMQATADGVPLEAKGWRIEFPQGSRRPALELIISDPKSKEHWRIELPSSASHALVLSGNAQGPDDQSVDLDATSGGTAPW